MVRKGIQKKQTVKRPGQKAAKPRKKVTYKYFIDCSIPVEDGIFDLENFEEFLMQKYKIDGKTGNLQDKARFFKQKNKIRLHTTVKISKRYLKYLAKKYLKKQELRDWLRVVSKGDRGYQLRYYNITQEEEEEKKEE